MINTDGEVRIGCTRMWVYESGGSYVSYSHLMMLWARMFIIECVHACWTMSWEVRRVGLRVGRFVELKHEQASLWKHMESLRPWLNMY